ncbi:cation:proton antiporter [Candidatus Woesearchaeota archaeon]|nr:cation:proton antiporter [Candidatus Woesearchaeota archaeon]
MAVFVLFFIAAVIIFIGFLGEIIFDKTNIPDVIWLMLVGIIIGLFFGDFTKGDALTQIAPVFTTFALVFILFEGAINLNITYVAKGLLKGLNLTLVNFIFSASAIAVIMMMFGWELLPGLLLGAALGGASSAVVVPIVKKLKIKKESATVLTIESALSDVLCIVSAITIINIIKLNTFNLSSVLASILGAFSIALLIGAVGGFIWVTIQNFLQKFSKSYMTTIAFLLVIYSFTEFVGANGAIACLAFGLMLGNAHKLKRKSDEVFALPHEAKFFYAELTFFIKSFFYVYLGMLMDFSNLYLVLIGLLITLVLFLLRPLSIFLTVGSKAGEKDRIFMEIMIPKGLAAAVLAQLALQEQIQHAEYFSTIVVSVILLSIILATVLVFFTERGSFKGVQKTLHDFLFTSKLGANKENNQK